MGFVRAPSAVIVASLAGMGLGACATHPADQADSTRLQWLANSLAMELAAAGPDDPRIAAAAEDLQLIAAYASEANAPRPMGLTAWVTAAEAPVAASVGFDLAAQAQAPAALSPLAAAVIARPEASPDAARMGLALGRFTDAGMAGVMWREIQGLDSAALTGLSGYTVRDDHGVVLMAGPVGDAESAEDRCMALTVWGLNCTPAAWPEGAQEVTGGGA